MHAYGKNNQESAGFRHQHSLAEMQTPHSIL
jgi:hypothetical protein